MRRTVFLCLLLAACDSRRIGPGHDSGTPHVDSGHATADSGHATADSGHVTNPDSGSPGLCMDFDAPPAISDVGCNGFLTGTQPANQSFGACTTGDTTTPQGSCASAANTCIGGTDVAGQPGICAPACDPGGHYATQSTCASGSRCFAVGDGTMGLCFRDCNSAHPCPGGATCDTDGSCPFPAPAA